MTLSHLQRNHLSCPNILGDNIEPVAKEANVPVKPSGRNQHFLPIKNHLELGEALGGSILNNCSHDGQRFVMYKGMGAELLYALIMFILKNNLKHGYTSRFRPCYKYHVTSCCKQFPNFRDQVYEIAHDGLYLSPTAQIVLTNLTATIFLRLRNFRSSDRVDELFQARSWWLGFH